MTPCDFISAPTLSAAPGIASDRCRIRVRRASKSIRDLRIAEVIQLDMQIEEGKSAIFRTKLKVSFKYEGK